VIKRKPQYKVDSIFINRWSPRALSPEMMSDSELMSLFEAARWAPSSYNAQQWRFIFAKRGTKWWDTFFNLLDPFNQEWAKTAPFLVVVISRKNFEYNEKPSLTHSFDTGAACENLALQASMMGLVAHAIGGFDYDRTRKELNIPDHYNIEVMFAIGKKGNKKDLSPELQEHETLSDRKKIEEFLFEGEFRGKK
jgi:nitroreductase